ncbi:MAG TPA: zf-TFIIB domain-containing protein [Thermoanaerobaculia bacterium]|jgi:Zn-finger nucleic acid-binding protein|nr:zf-TFIIB domain-containing protein [Thermoanaerobaculia bacterium]
MSEMHCPEDGTDLTGVALERANGTVHECPDCHGVWVERELIERLEKQLASGPPPPSAVGLPAGLRGLAPAPQRYHRPCAVCGSLMDVKACGGVVVDICSEHGVWFDPGELELFVAWVQAGQPQSGTHHRAQPLTAYLGLAAPAVACEGDGGWGAVELAGGVLEVLAAVAELLAP